MSSAVYEMKYDNQITIKDMQKLKTEIKKVLSRETENIFVCIGTDKVTGDAFGPLVGSYLKQYSDFIVYGCIGNTVNATNIIDYKRMIMRKHKNCNIICIDASLCISDERKHNIIIRNKGVNPALGINKRLPSIGDKSIVFNTFNKNDVKYYDCMFSMLQSYDIDDLILVSELVGNCIIKAM